MWLSWGFLFKNTKIHTKIYSDSGCIDSNSILSGKIHMVEEEAFLNSYLSCWGLVSRYKILPAWQCYGLSCMEIQLIPSIPTYPYIFPQSTDCGNKPKSPGLSLAGKLMDLWPQHQGCTWRRSVFLCWTLWCWVWILGYACSDFYFWFCFCTKAIQKLLHKTCI